MRLVAIKLPKDMAAKAVSDAQRTARKKQQKVQPGTLIAAVRVILVTTLHLADYPTTAVLDRDRLRRRIEIGFKRMKSLGSLHRAIRPVRPGREGLECSAI